MAAERRLRGVVDNGPSRPFPRGGAINMCAGLLRVLVLAVVCCALRYHHACCDSIRDVIGRRELVDEHVI
jgi:hypothetical protein